MSGSWTAQTLSNPRKAMSNLKPIRADLWQTLLNTRNVNPDASPESQGYLVLPDEAEELRKGRIPATWKPPITTPEVARNDVPSTNEEDEIPFNSGRAWSANDKMRMVRMRAGGLSYKVIAKKLGRKANACQACFYKIRDQPEYMAILEAGEPYDESDQSNGDDDNNDNDEEEEVKEAKTKDWLNKPNSQDDKVELPVKCYFD